MVKPGERRGGRDSVGNCQLAIRSRKSCNQDGEQRENGVASLGDNWLTAATRLEFAINTSSTLNPEKLNHPLAL